MQRSDLGLNLPRYQQLAHALADGIGRGDYPVGSLLPGEEELCKQFSFSRFTVREALRHLQETGLVQRRQGVGTCVIAAAASRTFSHTIESIENLQQYATETKLIEHKVSNVVADTALAEALGCTRGLKLLRIEALRVPIAPARAAPLAWTEIHLSAVYAGIADQLATHKGAIGTLIEQTYGEKITAIQQGVSAVAIDAKIARKLGVKPGSPGLKINRIYMGRDGRPFEFVTAVHPGSRFSLSMRLDRTKSS